MRSFSIRCRALRASATAFPDPAGRLHAEIAGCMLLGIGVI
jgi:hypothetical protein